MEAGKYKNYRWDVDREKLIKIAQGFPSHSCNNYMERKGNSALFMIRKHFVQIDENISLKSMKKPLVKLMKHPSSAKTIKRKNQKN